MVTTVLEELIRQYLKQEHAERATVHLEETLELSEWATFFSVLSGAGVQRV